MKEHQKHWSVDSWAAYLSNQDIPCMKRSKFRLIEIQEQRGEELSASDLSKLAGQDPFLCLRLLREAERRRTSRLGHEVTNPLSAVILLGSSKFRKLLFESPETHEEIPGLVECENRSYVASQLALKWGTAKADISPEELGMASLLAEIGELLLWSFAPEIPEQAKEMLMSGKAKRSSEAQVAVCGFRFKDLTLKCAEIWNLPHLLPQLIRGMDNNRANFTRYCVDTARHMGLGGAFDNALPDDIIEVKKLIPSVTIEWLVQQIPGMSEEDVERLVMQVNEKETIE